MLHHERRKVAHKLQVLPMRNFIFSLGLDEHKFLDYRVKHQAQLTPKAGVECLVKPATNFEAT